uniref:HDC07105 n=1 Tax=Drosophila melanogaster TaxID=7227 RepID=Q6IG71_DROME|nr:TPA_inf: HDC07105 [Drosophila melanogaster]
MNRSETQTLASSLTMTTWTTSRGRNSLTAPSICCICFISWHLALGYRHGPSAPPSTQVLVPAALELGINRIIQSHSHSRSHIHIHIAIIATCHGLCLRPRLSRHQLGLGLFKHLRRRQGTVITLTWHILAGGPSIRHPFSILVLWLQSSTFMLHPRVEHQVCCSNRWLMQILAGIADCEMLLADIQYFAFFSAFKANFNFVGTGTVTRFKRRAAGEIQTQSQIGCSINAADWQSSTPLPHRSSGGIPIPGGAVRLGLLYKVGACVGSVRAARSATAAQPDQEWPHQWVVPGLGGTFDGHKCVIHIPDARSSIPVPISGNQLCQSLMNGFNLESRFLELATLWP